MRKIQLLGLALVAMCAFSAFAVASASALVLTPALWLVNGLDLANGMPLATTTTGGLILKNELNTAEILCEGIFDGAAINNPSTPEQGLQEVTEVLTTGKVLVPELDEPSATGGIVCTNLKICTNGAEIWALGLPWDFDIYQDLEDGTEWFELLTSANYFIKCLVPLIGTVEELCVAQVGTLGQVLNVTGGVEPFGAGSLLATCNNNANDGQITADAGGLLAGPAGEVLAVSLNSSGT